MNIEKINETIQSLSDRLEKLDSDLESLLSDLEQFKKNILERTERVENRLYRTKKNLTIAEASEYTGFSIHTIYQLTSSKKIKYFKPNGKTIFIPKKDLENWLASNLQDTQKGIEELKKIKE